MGTNYYAKLGICVNCKKATEEYHIGKNSGGWVFLFRKQPFWKNYKEVKAFLNKKEVSIWDEYGKKTPKKVFFELVDGTYAGDILPRINSWASRSDT